LALKKFTAISFLILFSFNWFGYRLVYEYLQQRSNDNLEALFDRNLYNESELVELKIAVNIPYQTSRPDFERCDGEINVNGTIYKYVKRKLSNDTLYLMCLKNTDKMQLEKAKDKIYKLANDLVQNDQNGTTGHYKSVTKNLQPVYNESSFDVTINSPLAIVDKLWLPANTAIVNLLSHQTPEQPPDSEII
jgi:hypothetical protein